MTITLRQHQDGTFSLTGLTATDVDNLAHGMNSATAGLLTTPLWKLDNDAAYVDRTAAKYERLALHLRRLVANSGGRTYRAAITNDNAYGDPTHFAYETAAGRQSAAR